MENIYLCINLKSFYASVECVERGLDPLKTKLVVADPTRGNGAICLAITPALKKLGIKNRCRVFEIPKDVDYICAMPRMTKYMEASSDIYGIYLKYVASKDIHVYSIDECFLDVTKYLKMYGMSAKELAQKIIDDVYKTTGIIATCGIGDNLYLAKIALDILSKHSSDNIGILSEESFKDKLWHHTPITDFWGISTGTQNRLLKYGIVDQKGILDCNEDILYKEFGVNAELLIDHAKGIETCTMDDIHKFRPASNSLTQGQVLFENYKFEDAILILKEMVDHISLELVEKELVTNHIALMVVYSTGKYNEYKDRCNASKKLSGFTDSRKRLMDAFISLFKEKVDPKKLIRGINVSLGNVIHSDFSSIDLFTNIEEEAKEKRVQEALIEIKNKFGKNSVLKGMNLESKATEVKRNKLVGGHNAS